VRTPAKSEVIFERTLKAGERQIQKRTQWACDRLAAVAGFIFGSYLRAAVGSLEGCGFCSVAGLSLAEDEAAVQLLAHWPC